MDERGAMREEARYAYLVCFALHTYPNQQRFLRGSACPREKRDEQPLAVGEEGGRSEEGGGPLCLPYLLYLPEPKTIFERKCVP